MADRKPLKVLPDGGGDSTGLGEFVAADTVGIVDGGTGLATVGSNQLLTGNGTSALTSESNLTFDGQILDLNHASSNPTLTYSEGGTERGSIAYVVSPNELRLIAKESGSSMSLQTANSEAIYISSSQQVGFGTSSPSSDVDIRGPAADFGTLTLSTAETTIVNTDPLGRLDFRAPQEGSGSNAVLPTARLEARATETFDATHNQTDLLFLLANDGGVTEKMRMLSSGGLTFNGDTASANAIDDYEEGTWTPVLKYNGTSGTNYTLDAADGDYTKIGNVVYLNFSITVQNPSASNSDSVILGPIYGLPYTAKSGTEYSTACVRFQYYDDSNGIFPTFYVVPNTTRMDTIVSYANDDSWGPLYTDHFYRSSGQQNIVGSVFYYV